MNTTKKFN